MSRKQARGRSRRRSKGDASGGWVVPPTPAVFLHLTATDFRSGWSLDWSPELGDSPRLIPLGNATRPA